MKNAVVAVIFISLVSASFIAGSWYQKKQNTSPDTVAGRKVLYYVDPMDPAIKSDRPGVAPCGMAFEPVYAEDAGSASGAGINKSMPPGAVQVSPARQQLIGIKVAEVGKTSWNHTLRVTGRVAPDEGRIYRINAAIDGWIRKTFPFTTDSYVKKDEILATLYSPEVYSSVKNYLYALSIQQVQYNPSSPTQRYSPAQQLDTANATINNSRNSILNLGMTEHQLDEIARTHELVGIIEIRAPEAGFILARNVSVGHIEKGTELYRIADLSHIWVFADVFENEARYFRPGAHAKVTLPYQGRKIAAKVSNILPQFDAVARTMRVRLELDNRGFALRPGMFADIEIPVVSPPSVTVPVDAVIFSGTKKTVYIDDGNGFFEPRNVETGWSFGNRIEITKGLSPGERIVVSGNFLIDSESRMKTDGERKHDEHKDIACDAGAGDCKAGAGGRMKMAAIKPPESSSKQKDLVCGMGIDAAQAKAHGRMSEYQGKKYYFCSDSCKKNFDKDPKHYIMKHNEMNHPTTKSDASQGMNHPDHSDNSHD